ncbi:MAG TPA: dUTP diphosphatase [Phycisphaerales bacterium]|nr:dUTP diphosphatase [Phycisphaerales bacterium]
MTSKPELPVVETVSQSKETTVRFQRLSPAAVMPAYATAGAAGMDLSACVPAPLTIAPGAILVVPTGWALAIPAGFEGQVRPRSGVSTKFGVTVPNAPGTIDSDYRGELKVALINLGKEPFDVTPGMRIAQLVIAPVVQARLREVDSLDATIRGAGGFGSTGTS